MSITLEGSTSNSVDGQNWSGLWRFTKEKKSFLSFTFKQSGNVVPRDLYDYVSFVNEPPSAITPVPPGRKSKDYKAKAAKLKTNKVSRGRGRPPSISNIDSPVPVSTSADSNQETAQSNQNMCDEGYADGDSNANENLDMDENDDPADAGEGDEENNDLADGTGMEMEGDEKEQCDEGNQSVGQAADREDDQAQSTTDVNSLEAPEDTPAEGADAEAAAGGAAAAAAAETLPLGPDIVLEETHPLIGMWEGSFNVKIPTGEESIVERFFFYAVQGSTPTGGSSLAALVAGSDQLAARPESLSALPPDPLFPYALLPTTPSGGFGLGLGSLSLGMGPVPASTEPAVKLEDIVKPDPTGSEASTSAATSLQDVASSASSFIAPVAAESAANGNATPAAPTTVFPADFVVLLGFGRNSFGRFSVAGIYDEKTQELRCEKKYMVTKFSAKRGRRSYAECAATAAASGGFLPMGPHPAAPLVPPSTRQRLAPSAFGVGSGSLEDFGGDLVGKRKRSIGGYALQHSGKLPGSSSSKEAAGETYGYGSMNKGLGKGGKSSGGSSSSKESAQAQAAAALAAAVAAAGPNALVGGRNPDNDDPEAAYREAFMDCDTGEVYEGGWYYGLRHGKGVCIYSDGLMYEGAWVAGKEHGKGLLMTGDRQVIYTGDWLEGHMHGFGTYNFGNGDRYSGDWREGSRHGKGDYAFQNGCKYSGEWKDNRRSGRGMFVWTDGSYYSGDWELAQRHGRGKLELANGFVYDGTWARNVIEGKGVCKFPGGQEYEGTYKNGLREGRGTISFAEGAVYEGRFREDRFDGQGTLKVTHVVPGALPDEVMIPLQVQSDFWRIHLRAGFGNDPH